MTKFGTVNRKKMNEMAAKLMQELEIEVTHNLEEYSLALQQMIAIARAVDMDCKVLILDEPARGIDIGTKTEIQKLVLKPADEGKGVMKAIAGGGK